MDDELRVADKRQKIVDHACEDWLVLELRKTMPVNPHRVLRDIALGVDEHVKDLSRQALVHDLDGADFEHPMSVLGIKPGCFRVEHDFTHGGLRSPTKLRSRA